MPTNASRSAWIDAAVDAIVDAGLTAEARASLKNTLKNTPSTYVNQDDGSLSWTPAATALHPSLTVTVTAHHPQGDGTPTYWPM